LEGRIVGANQAHKSSGNGERPLSSGRHSEVLGWHAAADGASWGPEKVGI